MTDNDQNYCLYFSQFLNDCNRGHILVAWYRIIRIYNSHFIRIPVLVATRGGCACFLQSAVYSSTLIASSTTVLLVGFTKRVRSVDTLKHCCQGRLHLLHWTCITRLLLPNSVRRFGHSTTIVKHRIGPVPNWGRTCATNVRHSVPLWGTVEVLDKLVTRRCVSASIKIRHLQIFNA